MHQCDSRPPLPTLSSAPTVTRSVAPTDLPTAEPTTATKNPTFYPTLSPTKVETMIFQRLAIGASFLAVIIAYIFHSNTKQSALASRGLDGSLYKVREFRIEKRWGCQFCGYAKNVASSSICMQCGTNQPVNKRFCQRYGKRCVLNSFLASPCSVQQQVGRTKIVPQFSCCFTD